MAEEDDNVVCDGTYNFWLQLESIIHGVLGLMLQFINIWQLYDDFVSLDDDIFLVYDPNDTDFVDWVILKWSVLQWRDPILGRLNSIGA